MRLLVVQHAADCPPAHLGTWLEEAGVELGVVRAFAGEPLPQTLDGSLGLLVLGGQMGAYDDDDAPWLPHTRRLLAEAVTQRLPTLAVCLGHQLLGVAGGGRVAKCPSGQQTGVVPVAVSEAGGDDPLFGPLGRDASAVHWNNDLVLDLPEGAVELARTSAGNQAMRLGPVAWGVQFHPEVGVEEVRCWAESEVRDGRLAPEVARRGLSEVATAEPELHRTWRAFAHRFADVLGR